jgi:hypothetical protein
MANAPPSALPPPSLCPEELGGERARMQSDAGQLKGAMRVLEARVQVGGGAMACSGDGRAYSTDMARPS